MKKIFVLLSGLAMLAMSQMATAQEDPTCKAITANPLGGIFKSLMPGLCGTAQIAQTASRYIDREETTTSASRPVINSESTVKLNEDALSQENLKIEKERYEREAKESAQYRAEQKRVADKEEATKQAKSAQQAKHEQELRSGKLKPDGLLEAMMVYDATFGTDLASAPRLKPDGKMYAMSGIMEESDGGLNFTAQATPDFFTAIENLKNGIQAKQSTYFFAKIPEKLRAEFYETAKINMHFSIIGKYTANTGYSTVSGQKKSMPVFDAVYWQVN